MTDSPTDSKDSILQFCPGCGDKILWNKDTRFCMTCGMNLVPYIPRDKIQDWLSVSLTPEEIDEIYAKKPEQQPISQAVPVIDTYSYRTRRPWKTGAALLVPLVSVIIKLIVSVVILFVYMFIVIDDLASIDIDLFLDEHLVPITIIELATQIVFLIMSFLFTKIYFPYKAPKKERWESLGVPFGLNWKQWLIDIGIGAGFAILMTGLVYGVQWVSAYLTQFVFNKYTAQELLNADAGGVSLGLPTTVWFILLYSLLMIVSVGPSEEILFRGFCQKGIQDSFRKPKSGKFFGLLITAVYFTIFHIYIYILDFPLFFFTFIPYFSLSLILGFLYLWRKNLISAITAHALYNIIQFMIYVIVIS